MAVVPLTAPCSPILSAHLSAQLRKRLMSACTPRDSDTAAAARAVGIREAQALSQCIAQLWASVKEYGMDKCGVLEITNVSGQECPGDYA